VKVALDQDSVLRATRDLVEAVNDFRRYVSDKPDILTRGLLRRLEGVKKVV